MMAIWMFIAWWTCGVASHSTLVAYLEGDLVRMALMAGIALLNLSIGAAIWKVQQ